MKRKQTFAEAHRELAESIQQLIAAVVAALRVDKVCDWLTRVIRRWSLNKRGK